MGEHVIKEIGAIAYSPKKAMCWASWRSQESAMSRAVELAKNGTPCTADLLGVERIVLNTSIAGTHGMRNLLCHGPKPNADTSRL